MMFKRCIKDGEKMQEFQESWRTIFSEKSQRKTKRSAGFDEMARDEARHGKAFEGLLKRYFSK